MQAIILAAGFGRRMRPLSEHSHKALLPVGDSTILGRIVDGLRAIGVSDLLIVTGYRADDVRAFMRHEYPDMPVRYVHNARFEQTNNIVSLSLAFAETSFDRDVLVIECDLLFDDSVLRQLLAPGGGNIALVDRYRPGMDGTVVAVDEGVITQVFPPHLQGPSFVYGDKFKTLNIYRFDREFCLTTFKPLLDCYANLIDGNCYYELVLGMLVNMQRHRIGAAVVDGAAWAEVDDPNDLAGARYKFEPSSRAEVLDRAMGGHWSFDVLDFAYMRNLRFPTDGMIAAMRQALPELMRSYGSTQRVLNEKLAWHLLCDPSRVHVLHGASQVYPMLRRLFAGRDLLRPEPTFGEYARMFPDGATYADTPGHGVDLDAVERRMVPGGVVVFVTPNSPSGNVIGTEWIHTCAARHPETTVLVDESFIDFSGERPMVERLEAEPLANVLVLKSLSKSLGVPGLRLGYVYGCDARVLDAIGEEIPVWNLSAPAEFYLELLLKYRPELEAALVATHHDREAFAARLRTLPSIAQVFPSGGNYLLVRLASDDPDQARRVRAHLLERHGIDVKDVSRKFAPPAPYLRLAVRLPDENERFIAALMSDLPEPLRTPPDLTGPSRTSPDPSGPLRTL